MARVGTFYGGRGRGVLLRFCRTGGTYRIVANRCYDPGQGRLWTPDAGSLGATERQLFASVVEARRVPAHAQPLAEFMRPSERRWSRT